MNKPFVVACVSAYNGVDYIGDVVFKTMNFVNKVIVCDGGSSDSTCELAERLGTEVTQHDRKR